MGRNRHPRQPGSLKEATCALVAECGGDVAVAAELGVSKTLVHGWTDEDGEGQSRFINVEHVRRLERIAGRPIVTAWLAAEHGCAVVRLGDDSPSAPSLTENFQALAKAAAVAMSNIAVALSDGRFTQGEAALGRRDLREIMQPLASLDAQLSVIANGGEESAANVTAIPVKGRVG